MFSILWKMCLFCSLPSKSPNIVFLLGKCPFLWNQPGRSGDRLTARVVLALSFTGVPTVENTHSRDSKTNDRITSKSKDDGR